MEEENFPNESRNFPNGGRDKKYLEKRRGRWYTTGAAIVGVASEADAAEAVAVTKQPLKGVFELA